MSGMDGHASKCSKMLGVVHVTILVFSPRFHNPLLGGKEFGTLGLDTLQTVLPVQPSQSLPPAAVARVLFVIRSGRGGQLQ